MMTDPVLRDVTQLVGVDYGGPGRPVFDMFWEAYQNDRLGPSCPMPCTLSGRDSTATSKGHTCTRVKPSRRCSSASQRGRFTIPPDIELAETFRRELANFSIKQSKSRGNVRFEARGRTHNDLLISAAIALSRPHSRTSPAASTRCTSDPSSAPATTNAQPTRPVDQPQPKGIPCPHH